MYAIGGDAEIFWKQKPILCDYDRKIYSAFCRALRESESEIAPKHIILEELETINCETDIALELIRKINDYHLKLKREKKQKSEQAANKPNESGKK